MDDLRAMIADYMENGFLENIIDMFRHDRSLYRLVGPLMTDERMRVRIGVTALVETMAKEDFEGAADTIPSLAAVLSHENPTVRGDAAYLLGLIGNPAALPYLEAVFDERDPGVREALSDAIDDIRKRGST